MYISWKTLILIKKAKMIWKWNHIVSQFTTIIQRIIYYLLLKDNDIDVHIQWKDNIDVKIVLLSTRYFAVQFNVVLEITQTKIWPKIV